LLLNRDQVFKFCANRLFQFVLIGVDLYKLLRVQRLLLMSIRKSDVLFRQDGVGLFLRLIQILFHLGKERIMLWKHLALILGALLFLNFNDSFLLPGSRQWRLTPHLLSVFKIIVILHLPNIEKLSKLLILKPLVDRSDRHPIVLRQLPIMEHGIKHNLLQVVPFNLLAPVVQLNLFNLLLELIQLILDFFVLLGKVGPVC
jgi:hypothetical protein